MVPATKQFAESDAKTRQPIPLSTVNGPAVQESVELFERWLRWEPIVAGGVVKLDGVVSEVAEPSRYAVPESAEHVAFEQELLGDLDEHQQRDNVSAWGVEF